MVSTYTILGGIDDHSSAEDEQAKDESIITEKLRHFINTPRPQEVQLRIQTHETSGRVSMAGTLW